MTMRIRQRGGFSNHPVLPVGYTYNYESIPPLNTWNVAWSGIANTAVGKHEIMTDTITPHYKKRVAKGDVLPTNPLSHLYREVTVLDDGEGVETVWKTVVPNPPRRIKEDGFWLMTYLDAAGIKPLIASDPLRPEFLFTTSEMEDLITEATTECLSSRGSADQSLLESVAEYRSTFAMLRHPIKSLIRIAKSARGTGGKLNKSAAEIWLTYRYGILPLIRDIMGIIEGAKKARGYRKTTSRGNRELTKESERIVIADYNVERVSIRLQTFDIFSARAVSYDEHVWTLLENIGFAQKDMYSLPWELLPYSLVADWMLNIGSYLRAISPSPGFKQLASSLATKRQTGTTFTVVGTTLNTAGSINHTLVRPASGAIYAYERTKGRSSLGTAGVVIKSDFGFERMTRDLDAYAFAYNLLDGFFRKR